MENRTEKLTLTVAETARLLGVSVPIAYELGEPASAGEMG